MGFWINMEGLKLIWYPVCFMLYEKERKNLVLQNVLKKNCYEKENNRLKVVMKKKVVFLLCFIRDARLIYIRRVFYFNKKRCKSIFFIQILNLFSFLYLKMTYLLKHL